MSRNVNPTPQFFDSAGDPLVSGKMYYFESGTSTPKTTFADVNETIANTHPVILTGDGRLPNVFFSGSAKQRLNAADDEQLWERDPVTAADQSSFGANWDAITIFSKNEVVTLENILYVSIINDNQNNNPATSPTAWTRFDLLKRFNINETYNLSDPVIATDLTLYISRVGSNLGNDPVSSPEEWIDSGLLKRFNINETYSIGDPVTGADQQYYISLINSNLGNDPTTDDGTNWDRQLSKNTDFFTLKSGRNYLLNPEFRINQSGVGPTSTFTAQTFLSDQWYGQRVGTGSAQLSQITGLVHAFAQRLEAQTAGTFRHGQRIEGARVFDSSTITLQFKILISAAATNTILRVLLPDNTIASTAFTPTGSIQTVKLTTSIATPTAANDYFAMEIEGDLAINEVIEIHDSQTVVAADPIAIEPREESEELFLCKKFYRRFERTSGIDNAEFLATGQATSTTSVRMPLLFGEPEMRAAPTLGFSAVNALAVTAAGGSLIASTAIASFASDKTGVALTIDVAAGLLTGNASVCQLNVVDYIDFDARQ